MNISLTTMHYFLEAAKYENFSTAANRLYTAQPNLSKKISGLEQELGITLFRRDGRHVYLTDAGRLLYEEWSSALGRIEGAIRQARNLEQDQKSFVTIGILEGMSLSPQTPMHFKELQKHRPGLNLRLERCGTARIWQEFESGAFDMIVVCELHDNPHPIPPFCSKQLLYTCGGAIAINAGNPIAGHEKLTLPMLREEGFVAISQEEIPEGYRTLQDVCRRAGFEPKVMREASSIETLLLYVEAGIGAAVLSGNSRLASNPNIRLVPLEDILFDVAVFWHADPDRPAAGAIQEVLAAELLPN